MTTEKNCLRTLQRTPEISEPPSTSLYKYPAILHGFSGNEGPSQPWRTCSQSCLPSPSALPPSPLWSALRWSEARYDSSITSMSEVRFFFHVFSCLIGFPLSFLFSSAKIGSRTGEANELLDTALNQARHFVTMCSLVLHSVHIEISELSNHTISILYIYCIYIIYPLISIYEHLLHFVTSSCLLQFTFRLPPVYWL